MSRVAKTLLVLIWMTLTAASAAADVDAGRIGSLLASGRYGDADAELVKALKEAPDDPVLLEARTELLMETGRYEEAGRTAARAPKHPRLLTLRAESLFKRGRLDDAEKALHAALEIEPDLLRARYDTGLLLRERGRRDEARTAFEWFFDHYAMNDVTDAEDLTLTAAATVRYAELSPDVEMDFQETAEILQKVAKEHPDYLRAYLEMADLFLLVFQDKNAKQWYQKVLEKNPRHPDALMGLARQSALVFNEMGGAARAREALLTNPNHFEAKEYLARVHAGDSEYEEARNLIAEVLAVNPRRKPARALDAVVEFLLGDRAGFGRKVAAILKDDPHYGPAYWELALALEQQRRFAEATVWARKGTEVDDTDPMAWLLLGRNLVHEAKEEEAREALIKSRDVDPFEHYHGNPFRHNLIEVLGHIEEFVETRTPNFIFRIHVGENEVLARYYHRFMEESLKVLEKEYGFKPEGPILTEVFHIHADFAARTIGLPGIGALGACFGKVITLDSPSARGPGDFTWASTAHHELAHVMTLQLSGGRVPRWFTEGLSVLAERRLEKWWYRDLDRKLYDAVNNGELPPILKFNSRFRSGDVLFAYYLGGMISEFIVEKHGFPKVVEMLKAYRDDKQTAEVLENVLGVTAEEFDRRFEAWGRDYVKDMKLVPRWSKKTVDRMKARLDENPKDADALITIAWSKLQRGKVVDAMNYLGKSLEVAADDPRVHLLRGEVAFRSGRSDRARKWYEKFLSSGQDDLFARIHLAKILEQEGDFEGALAHYEAAKKCFGGYIGPGNPYLELARLKQGDGDLDGAMKEIQTYVTLANTDIPHRLELATYYEAKGDWESVARVLDQVVKIYPLGERLSMPVHVRLARALKKLGRLEDAILELEVALEIGVGEEDEPEVRTDLAEAYLLTGKVSEARYQARSALEKDPDLERAKKVLERTGEK